MLPRQHDLVHVDMYIVGLGVTTNSTTPLHLTESKGLSQSVFHGAAEIRFCMGSIDLMDLKRLDPINE